MHRHFRYLAFVCLASFRGRLVSLHCNLWHEDRAAAAQGVESRVPFLDHRLVELLASEPPRLHRALFWDKRLLRHVARRWLPAG